MRTHTDPGLLTATAASEVPGLMVLDTASRAWVDVEAACRPNELIVFSGEALELMSRGAYPAAPHRVRRASAARLSVVFELRLHDAEPLGRPPRMHAARKRERSGGPAPTAAEEQAEEGEEGEEGEEDAAAVAYMHSFVEARLARGSDAESILREFHVVSEAWPPEPDGLGVAELSRVLIRWVQERRERELAAATFEAAEYVEVSP
eukprot:1875531-Prymnesium_polylepis.1